MSLITRVSRGLIYEDHFDHSTLNSVWQVSPSDTPFSLIERSGFLRLWHGNSERYVLMDAPEGDYVFDVFAEYNPIDVSHRAGITCFYDLDNHADLIEYYDPEEDISMTYERIRFIKKDLLVQAFGTNDNGKSWILVGAALLDAPKVGLILHGVDDIQSAPIMDVDRVSLYRSHDLIVDNLLPGQIVQLRDTNNQVLSEGICQEERTYAVISGFNLTFPIQGKIAIYDTEGDLIDVSDEIHDIWGGDEFAYGIKLDLEMNDEILDVSKEHFLDAMIQGKIERRMYVVNNNSIPINNVRLMIEAYSPYTGHEWVGLGTDSVVNPITYQKTLDIGRIEPGQRFPVWMQIIRNPYDQITNLKDYKFRVILESR